MPSMRNKRILGRSNILATSTPRTPTSGRRAPLTLIIPAGLHFYLPSPAYDRSPTSKNRHSSVTLRRQSTSDVSENDRYRTLHCLECIHLYIHLHHIQVFTDPSTRTCIRRTLTPQPRIRQLQIFNHMLAILSSSVHLSQGCPP